MSRPEDDLQRSIVQICEIVWPRYKGRVLWFHVPNGGARSKTEAAIFKGLGVIAGVPDLVMIWPGFGWSAPDDPNENEVLLVELKAGRGRLNTNQRRIKSQCEKRVGVPYEVVRSVDEFIEICQAYDLPGAGRLGP